VGDQVTIDGDDGTAVTKLVLQLKQRVELALEYALRFGGADGSHHKAWVIDQMVRALTGCPQQRLVTTHRDGDSSEHVVQGKGDEYIGFVRRARAGFNGPDTYEWDEGIAP